MILNKNIKEYCKEQKELLKKEIEQLCPDGSEPPSLAVIQVGDNEASNRYIRNKRKDCEEVGIEFEWYYFEDDITQEQLEFEIKALEEHYDGVIVQLPLPPQCSVEATKTAISPEKDVDGFHPMTKFDPCTPGGIVDYLENGCNYNFEGKNVTIIGRSEIVGRPLAKMLMDRNATVTVCHSKTKNIRTFIDTADLIICAVGKAKFLNCYSIHKPVVDVGINFDEEGKLVGDCFNTEDRDVTPVPGGVGLLTRVQLLRNVLLAYKQQRGGKTACMM